MKLFFIVFFLIQAAPPDTTHYYEVVGFWSPPTNCDVAHGPPWVYYLQKSLNGEIWQDVSKSITDTTYTFKGDECLEFFEDHRIRVAAYDTLGRLGPFSYPSKTFTPSDSLHIMPFYPEIGEFK